MFIHSTALLRSEISANDLKKKDIEQWRMSKQIEIEKRKLD